MDTTISTAPLCPNCQTELAGRFCSACGQEHFGHEPNLKELLADVWTNMFSVDGRLLNTLRSMVKTPGQLTLEYFEGRRARYVTPFKLYLTCSAFYFLVANFSDIQMKIEQNGKPITASQVNDATSQQVILIMKEALAYYFGHLSSIFFLIVPLTALATAILFAGRKKNLLFHLVFALHVWSAVLLVGSILSVLHVPFSAFKLFLVVGFLYAGLASRRTFKAAWWEAGLKGLLFGFSALCLSIIGIIIIVLVIAVQKKSQGVHLSASPTGTLSTTSTSSSANP